MTPTEIERDGLEPAPAQLRTAAEKIVNTLRELSRPGDDAGEMELTLATVCMGLERGLGEQIAEQQRTGELDAFVLSLVRFLALHRSDDAKQLVVVELPARPPHGELARGRTAREKSGIPPATRLHLLDEAIAAASTATSPF